VRMVPAREIRANLPINRDLVAARARDANHDAVGALMLGEHQVAMVRLAGEQLGAAGSAGAGLARARHLEALIAQGFEDGLGCRYIDDVTGARESNLEWLVGRLVRLGVAEGLEMHGSR